MGGRDLTTAAICDAVESVLGAVTGIVRSESYDELTEGIQDVPLLQVWPASGAPVSSDSGTHKFTLGGDDSDFTIQETITIYADLWAKQRAHIGEDMSKLVGALDNICAELRKQDCDPFDLEGLQSFQWSWVVGTAEWAKQLYLRVRFTLVFRVF